jgi:hypothetical protein
MPGLLTLRRILPLAFLGIALVLTGCARPVTEVTGNIKLRGQAPNMTGLHIVFMSSSDGSMHAAPIEADGNYKAKDVPAGEAKVGFMYSPESKGGGQATKSRLAKPGANKEAPPPAGKSAEGANPIPKDLREPGMSNITFNVTAGQTNKFDYDITAK